jgi:hypothetical protein
MSSNRTITAGQEKAQWRDEITRLQDREDQSQTELTRLRAEVERLTHALTIEKAKVGITDAIVKSLDEQIAKLTAKLEEAQKDTARPDWLEALPCAFTLHRDHPKADSLPKLRVRLDEAMHTEAEVAKADAAMKPAEQGK